MGLPINRTLSRLPRRFPVGATYVVEGFGAEEGHLRVIARYLVLPGGQRINFAADPPNPPPPRALAFRRRTSAKQSSPKQTGLKTASGKKFSTSRGNRQSAGR